MLTPLKSLLAVSFSFFVGGAIAGGGFEARKPVVYLTFDDGPSADSSTDELLDVLARFGAEATFFVTGQRAAREPNKISAILYAGHAIGNHTHSHASLVNQSADSIESEFVRAGNAVSDAGGPPLTCYRPPFGRSNSTVRGVGTALGMTQVKWTIDTRDWEARTARDAIYRSLSRVKEGSIVLMHDGPSKRGKSIAALVDWLEANAHRYQFNALPQCKPYGVSEVFAGVDEQEIDLQIERENIQSLLDKLRSYRFSLQLDETSASSAYAGQFTAQIF